MHHLMRGRGPRPDLTAAQGRIPASIHEESNEESNKLWTEGYLRDNINIKDQSAHFDNSQAAHTYSQTRPTRSVAGDPFPSRAYSVDNGQSNLICRDIEGSRPDERDGEDLQCQFQRSGRSFSTPSYFNEANGMAIRPKVPIQQQKTCGGMATQNMRTEDEDASYLPQFRSASIGSVPPITGQDRDMPSIQRRPVGSGGNGRRQMAVAAGAKGHDYPQTDSSYSQSNNVPRDLYETSFSNPIRPIPTSLYGTSFPSKGRVFGSYGNESIYQPSKSTKEGVAPNAGFDPQNVAAVNGPGGLGINREESYSHAMGNSARYFAEPQSDVSSTPSRNNSMASSNSQYSSNSAAVRDSYGGEYEDDKDSIDFPQGFEVETIEEEFDCEVLVFQGDMAIYATMTFDTGCKGSNWVSLDLVRKLRAPLTQLPRPAEFQAFNGQPLIAMFETKLSFRKDEGPKRGLKRTTRFLVAPNKDVRFDILLGAGDCRRFSIIEPPMLSLLPRTQTEAEKKKTKANIDKNMDEVRKHEKQRQRSEQKKRAAEAALRGQQRVREG